MTDKGGKVHTFDIWGCCVSRDSFGIPADHGKGIGFSSKADVEGDYPDDGEFRYQIRNYYPNCSLMAQFKPQHGPNVESNDIVCEGISKSMKEWICADYNKKIFGRLMESGSEWLIVDFRTESYGLLQIENNDGTLDYITCDPNNNHIRGL